jgi:hypothetical protein
MKNENKKRLRRFNYCLFLKNRRLYHAKKIHIYKWIKIMQKHFEIDKNLSPSY